MSTNNADESHAESKAEAKHENEKVHPRRRKPLMDALIYICGAFVVIGGLWLGYLGVSGHLRSQQSLGLWVLYGTVFFVLTGAFLYFQSLIWKNREAAAREVGNVRDISPADRPWLSVDIVPNGDLTFEDNNVNVRTRFIIRNTGRSAATGATISASVIAPKLGGDIYKEVAERQKDICSNAGTDILPRTVFPGDGFTADWTFSVGRNELEKTGIEGTKIIGLFIIGCVNYRFADQPTRYQTGFVREIHVFKPETPGARYGLSLGENVPANRLVFDVGSFGGGDYAH